MKNLRHPLTLAFALGLALWAGPAFSQGAPIGPSNWFTCNKNVPFVGTAALAQVVAAATGPLGPGGAAPSIYVCGFLLTNTAASGTFILQYGTGSNCGTGTTPLTPTGGISVSQTSVILNQQIPTISTPAGQALCQNSTATITGYIFYAQF